MSTKDTVLALFEKNKGFFVSGERIADELDISRTAVWKAVKKLQSEGYEIKAITNRGYCLDKDSDVLTERGIRAHLGDFSKDLRPEVFVRVDSTNSTCFEKAVQGEKEGYVAVAGSQSAGRGRRGKAFFSPADSGIYMSILLKPDGLSETEMHHLNALATVAVCEAIEELSGKETHIKWFNDILIEGKKVSGVLSEIIRDTYSGEPVSAVVGIGINAYTPGDGFPSSIAGIAGSVFDETATGLKNKLAAAVLDRLMYHYSRLPERDYSESYRRRFIAAGEDITVHRHGSDEAAVTLGLTEDFGLMVRYKDGREEVLDPGDVSIS